MIERIKHILVVYKSNYRHWICTILIVVSLLYAIFYFKYADNRLMETLIDLKNSAIYYICELFDFDYPIQNTINDFTKQPFEMPFDLPSTWDEFKAMWTNYWDVFFSKETLGLYLQWLSYTLNYISKLLVILIPMIMLFIVIFNTMQSNVNNDYNQDSNSLGWFKNFFEKRVYLPVKNWLLGFISFINENSFYRKIWAIIWAYNFNLLAILITLLGYYLYLVSSFDLISLYRQLLKLLMDLSVPIDFLPLGCWIWIGLYIMNYIRRKIGYANLNHMEMKNRGFINERPIVIMLVGSMGKKKTTIGTDIALSQEIMFRDKAFEKILEADLKFPFFPWINLENALKFAMENHIIYNLATTRKYVKHLKCCFECSLIDKATFKSIKKHLKKRYNIDHKNTIFDYDYERYEMYYDDKLKIVDIWKVIEDYSQLYFVYIIQSSLLVSNYSIRVDSILEDLGNFPLWNTDLFQRDSRMIDCYSRHAHILDFDSLRLGKKMIDENMYANSFEFGVINITEIGKERGNNLELQQVKKNDTSTNQKNDLFNSYIKMCRHSATIDNYPFIRFITDEQRPESWGADARDLCEIVHIDECSDMKLAMPLFALGDLILQILLDKFNSKYYNYRFERGDNTLGMYLFHGLTAVINKYHKGIYNTFGYYKLKVSVENGTQDGNYEQKNYYLMFKKIYSKRFSTDCFSEYFNEKALKSAVGINDIPEFASEKASFEEMLQENSYFFNDLIRLRNREEK